MSDVSKIKNEFESFVSGLLAKLTPDAAAEVQSAAAPVHQAISDAESAAVTEVEDVAVAAVPTLEGLITKAVPGPLGEIINLAAEVGLPALKARLQASTSAAA